MKQALFAFYLCAPVSLCECVCVWVTARCHILQQGDQLQRSSGSVSISGYSFCCCFCSCFCPLLLNQMLLLLVKWNGSIKVTALPTGARKAARAASWRHSFACAAVPRLPPWPQAPQESTGSTQQSTEGCPAPKHTFLTRKFGVAWGREVVIGNHRFCKREYTESGSK